MAAHVLVVASALFSVGYILPTLLGVARHAPLIVRLLAINLLLGWTVVGWFWALALACRRPRPWNGVVDADEWAPSTPGSPESPSERAHRDGIYADGSYLVSAEGTARTWAVCAGGAWGIAYELDGTQRTAAWVDSSDIPMDVLLRALACDPSDRWS